MTLNTRFSIVTLLGNSVAAISLAIVAIFLVLWTRSFHGADTFKLPASGDNAVYITSYEGRFMFGIFEADDQHNLRWGWGFSRHVGMPDLVLNEDTHVVGDFWGWGVAVPHLLIVGVGIIPLLWWIFVFRDRQEYFRRVRQGLCLECGYDVRHASGRCPECGTPCGATLAGALQ